MKVRCVWTTASRKWLIVGETYEAMGVLFAGYSQSPDDGWIDKDPRSDKDVYFIRYFEKSPNSDRLIECGELVPTDLFVKVEG